MATNEQPWPTQTAPLWVIGSPEGRDYAPLGYFEIDARSGIWWRKTTCSEYNTGWVMVAGGGIVFGQSFNVEYMSPVDLPIEPADPTQCWKADFMDGSPSMRWSVIQQAWI